ncbi:unnamed protein product [Parascedosporium putredinis]|uniref:Uncharacterized protein n=1 Tax=Parascedosporium putredinis TaxID=1442378 RepID=A0A9P1MCU9_9PEZI|nr:unnamed protein product [Parascedosporium putredinis]CAI8002305.1 unnamed protein product [Parascedosporium putredinis]
MVMKRKRSISEFSSSPTRPSSSCFTSPSGSINFTFSHAGPSSPSPMPTMDTTPLHLHSRTLKRFRDSRPSEQQVHQRTLGLLYSAQRQQQLPFAQNPPSAVFPDAHAAPIPQEADHAVVHASSNGTQRSLHNFWALPSAPAPSVASPSRPQPWHRQRRATTAVSTSPFPTTWPKGLLSLLRHKSRGSEDVFTLFREEDLER